MPAEFFFDIEQGSDQWRAIRVGIPTASVFSDVLAKGEGKTRRKLLMKLAGERITGQPEESYENFSMQRGREMEPEIRAKYAFTQGVDPQLVGFVRNGAAGCSPDSLIGENGMLEIKTEIPSILIETIFKGDFPSKHVAQCQGGLWVAEREWIDIAIGYSKMPPLFVKRAYRDAKYIANLSREVAAFNAELEEVVERVRSYTGDNHAAVKDAFERSLAQ